MPKSIAIFLGILNTKILLYFSQLAYFLLSANEKLKSTINITVDKNSLQSYNVNVYYAYNNSNQHLL